MATITFVLQDGARQTLQAEENASVMAAAVNAGIRGINGECGGYCQCATCHVYIDDAWIDRLVPMSEIENEMLDGVVAERLPGSRLSCQVVMTPEVDGVVVRIPDTQ